MLVYMSITKPQFISSKCSHDSRLWTCMKVTTQDEHMSTAAQYHILNREATLCWSPLISDWHYCVILIYIYVSVFVTFRKNTNFFCRHLQRIGSGIEANFFVYRPNNSQIPQSAYKSHKLYWSNRTFYWPTQNFYRPVLASIPVGWTIDFNICM